jgi:PAS domain S-box-containing protein
MNNDLDRLNAIIQSIAEGLVVVDLDGNIQEINKKFEELLGWTRKEVIDKKFTDVVRKVKEDGTEVDAEKRVKTIESDEIETQKESVEQYYYIRKDGSSFPVSISSAPIIEASKQIGIVQLFKDITEQFEVDKAKTDFVMLSSHQMRTPLTVIKWYSEMLLDEDKGNLSIQQRSYLSKIFDGLDRINNLINTFLKITKLQMGKYEFSNKIVDVEGLLSDIRKAHKKEINGKKLLVDMIVPPSLEKLYIDPQILEMIISNILSNAIKYSPNESQIKVKLFQISKEKGEKHLAIEIEDKGVGIPKEQQHLLFTKLFRGDNVKKIDTEGSGIGLYILKLLVDKAKGEINFESTEGKGSIFRVFLPLTEQNSNLEHKTL